MRARWTALIVLVSTAVFVFGEGPFWTHVWDVSRIDRALWYSYALVPILVLGVLLLERRLAWSSLLIGTIETTAYKFGATFLIAHAAWSFAEPAPRLRSIETSIHVERKHAEPSIIDPAQTGSIRGVAPPGSLVYVESGLEHLVFAPIDRPLTLSHDGRGLTPPISIAQAGQRIEVVSHDGRMHTLRATDLWVPVGQSPPTHLRSLRSLRASLADRRPVIRRNVAVVPWAKSAIPPFERSLGELALDCTVHRGEERAHLIVLGHPFFARVGDDGAFAFTGVPAGKLRIAVHGRTSVEVDLRAGESVDLR